MRDVAREAPHLFERRLEAAERLVEHDRELPEFVVRVGHRQAIVQVGGLDEPRPLGHRLHRRQRTAGEPVTERTRSGHANRQAQGQNREQPAQVLAHLGF